MLATGVASTTPVYHAENIIADYRIKLDIQNTNTQDYHNLQNIPATIPTSQGNTNNEEIIVNFRSTNAYVNIIGTKYDTKVYQDYLDIYSGGTSGTVLDRTKQEILNKNSLNANTNYTEFASTDMYVFQIDSYNYNINNDLNFTFSFEELEDYDFNGLVFVRLKKLYFLKETYITYQNNWSSYLQRQNISLQASVIKNEIEDVNNGFYYTKTTEEIDVDTIIQADYQDFTNISLTPNGRTYVVIKYTPMGIQENDNNSTWEETDENYPLLPINNQVYNGSHVVAPAPTNNIWIEGRNIIPDSNIEVIDLPGLMWEILTMPFAFVSQAFNLTLFPGTPYQINISNLFLSIIAVAVFIWLISFFLKMKG